MAPDRPSRSGRFELTVGLLALAGIVTAGAALAVRRNTPVLPGLFIEPGGLDFGTAWEQPAFRHAFTVTNPTDKPIRVAEIKTGCGCTTVEPQSFAVPPGGRQELVATLDLSGRGGAPFYVELLPRLAQLPPAGQPVWRLGGTVRPAGFSVAPELLDFGDELLEGAEPEPRTFKVRVSDSDLSEIRVETPEPTQLAVQLQRRGTAYAAEVRPPALPGPFSARLSIVGIGRDGRPGPVRTVPVRGTVRTRVEAIPGRVLFGAVRVGETATADVTLVSHTGEPFEVTAVEPASDTVTARPVRDLSFGATTRTFRVERHVASEGEEIRKIVFRVRLPDEREPRVIEVYASSSGIMARPPSRP